MADRPILFSAPMVRALLEGRKTQTRRVLRGGAAALATEADWKAEFIVDRWYFNAEGPTVRGHLVPTIRFAAGDRLWVRENFRVSKEWDDDPPAAVLPGDVVWKEAEGPAPHWTGRLRRGMHMPRWASRLTLHVTDVRVQRLQDISEADAIAEGVYVGKASGRYSDDYVSMAVAGAWFPTARGWYANLMDRLHGEGLWASNPWVAVVSFTVEHANIDAARAAA